MSIKEFNLTDVAIFRITEGIEKYSSYASFQNDNYPGIESVISFISKLFKNEDPSLLNSDNYCRNSIAPTPELCFVAIYRTKIIGMTSLILVECILYRVIN